MRLFKESREVVWLLAGAVAVIAGVYLEWGANAQGFAYFAFAFACAAIAGGGFGHELSNRTLSALLCQPVPRPLIWREKVLVSGIAIAFAFAIVWLCTLQWPGGESLGFAALIALCAWAGAPFWTLAARNPVAGYAATIAAPCTLLLLGAGALAGLGKLFPSVLDWGTAMMTRLFPSDQQQQELGTYAATALLLVYSAVVCRAGFVLFRHYQVIEGSARELVLPEALERKVSSFAARFPFQLTGSFGALVKKELRIQQTIFVLAAGFCIFGLAGLALRPFYPELTQVLWTIVFSIYVLLVPFLSGALAVSEEQAWGVADWQLVLPASARRQWSCKMLVTLCTSVALGLLLPAVAVCVGVAVAEHRLPEPSPGSEFLRACVLVLLAQSTLTSVAALSATRCSNTLRAALLGMGICVAVCACAVWVGIWFAQHVLTHLRFLPPRGLLEGMSGREVDALVGCTISVGLFIMFLLTQRFGFANFRRRRSGGRTFGAQVLAMVALGVICAMAVAALLPS